MAKMGKAEATVDPEFDQAAANFKEQHNKTKKLSKFVHGYEQSIAGTRSRLMPCAGVWTREPVSERPAERVWYAQTSRRRRTASRRW